MRGYLGNQGRNRPKGPRHGGGGMRDGNRDGNRGNTNGGRQDEMMHEPEHFADDDAEIISPAELTQSRSSMNLTELKSKPIHELVKLAESMGMNGTPSYVIGKQVVVGAVGLENLKEKINTARCGKASC